jgi:PBP1b-binding outer membrane lipoprotein LpoB
LSAQDNRRLGRTVVCGALLVYGCLRIPAAAQSVAPQEQELHQLQENVRHLETRPQQILDGLEELKKLVDGAR